MAIIIAASFVPSFARAEAPDLEAGMSLVNEWSIEKASTCRGSEKAMCETAFNDVINALRDLLKAESAKAAAKQRGDQAEVNRLSHEIIRIGNGGVLKTQIAQKYLRAKGITVGTAK